MSTWTPAWVAAIAARQPAAPVPTTRTLDVSVRCTAQWCTQGRSPSAPTAIGFARMLGRIAETDRNWGVLRSTSVVANQAGIIYLLDPPVGWRTNQSPGFYALRERESVRARAPVAQWIERRPPEPKVAGSNPVGRASVLSRDIVDACLTISWTSVGAAGSRGRHRGRALGGASRPRQRPGRSRRR